MVTITSLKCAGESDLGRVRENNEDRVYFDLERGIFIVIDGVGGEAAGEVAADTAVRVVRARLERPTGGLIERVREAITLANNEIYRLAQTTEEWRGMACVLTIAVIEDGQAAIGHVGNTRLYKLCHGRINKITRDHSPVGEQEDSCQLTEIEAMNHPRRNEIYRDVGSMEHTPDDENFIDTIQIPFEPESALLMCTDGLSDLVASAQMLRAVEHHVGNRSRIVRHLIDMANEAGGKDNITVLFIEGEQFAPALRKHLVHSIVDSPNQPRPSKLTETAAEEVIPSKRRPALRAASLQTLRLMWNRWAFLIYGVLLGILLFGIWQARFVLKPASTEPNREMNMQPSESN